MRVFKASLCYSRFQQPWWTPAVQWGSEGEIVGWGGGVRGGKERGQERDEGGGWREAAGSTREDSVDEREEVTQCESDAAEALR